MSQKVDLRIQKTQQLIRSAFISLLIEVGFEKITVSALCQKARINRATFYRHYTDKYELADRVLDSLLSEPFAEVRSSLANDPLAGWQLLFEHIAEYAAFYQALLGEKGIPRFVTYLQNTVEERMCDYFTQLGVETAQLDIPFRLSIRYLAAGQIGIIKWWLENDMPFPPSQAASYLVNLHVHGGLQSLGIGGLA